MLKLPGLRCFGNILSTSLASRSTRRISSAGFGSIKTVSTTRGIHGTEQKSNQRKTIYKEYPSILSGWLIAGPFLLTWAVIRDSFEFWAILYQSLDALETKEYRLEQFVTSKFISDVQLVLSSIRTSDVSASQLVEQILMLDNSEHQEEGSADSRHALASDFFNQFAKAQNDPMIEVQLIRRLLPDRPGNFYDEEYLLRAQHIHIPWLNKGVKRYQQKIGSIVIGGVPIPKTLGVGSSLLSKENLEILQRAARDLDHKLFTAMSNTRALATMMEEHARRLSKLTGNQEAPEERDSAW